MPSVRGLARIEPTIASEGPAAQRSLEGAGYEGVACAQQLTRIKVSPLQTFDGRTCRVPFPPRAFLHRAVRVKLKR